MGKAREGDSVFRTEKRRDAHGKSYPWIIRSTAMSIRVFFLLDRDFGPLFIKFCSSSLPASCPEWARVAGAR